LPDDGRVAERALFRERPQTLGSLDAGTEGCGRPGLRFAWGRDATSRAVGLRFARGRDATSRGGGMRPRVASGCGRAGRVAVVRWAREGASWRAGTGGICIFAERGTG
jgi:hypothetical protein